ncbi:GNAT family N-acetyltransferase [Hansschlegelia sp. KR7-227]|uniref:GNAT family N-acetyltransferase n=1 Tax=Hansschlegelia sp. KR7-227 TaxID=3400914 RepID=UPI003BFADAA2
MITLDDTPDEAAQNLVSEGLSRFNEVQVGPFPASPIWVVARDDNGALIGGVQAFISWTWLYLSMLWVDESARGAGVGSCLMRQAEQIAVDKGCTDAFLYTFSFQAPEFYRRRGYETFGELERFPDDHRQLWMRKKLVAAPDV